MLDKHGVRAGRFPREAPTSPPHVRSEHDLVSLATETQPHDPPVFAPHMRGTCNIDIPLVEGNRSVENITNSPSTTNMELNEPLKIQARPSPLSPDDISPDEPDSHGRTLLWWASRRGKTEVVRRLLTRGDVNPDKPDENGQTPLSAASGKGHEAVVRLLLARSNVDPDKPDNDGRTPLWHASLNANESVVKLLLSRDDVSPNKPDNYGRTLLWWASGSGKTEVVRGLLTRHDVDPDKPDNIGRTPLLIASIHGHREVAALLQLRTHPTCNVSDGEDGHDGEAGHLQQPKITAYSKNQFLNYSKTGWEEVGKK